MPRSMYKIYIFIPAHLTFVCPVRDLGQSPFDTHIAQAHKHTHSQAHTTHIACKHTHTHTNSLRTLVRSRTENKPRAHEHRSSTHILVSYARCLARSLHTQPFLCRHMYILSTHMSVYRYFLKTMHVQHLQRKPQAQNFA